MSWLAISPIALLVFLLFVIRWPLIKAAPLTFVFSLSVAVWQWSLESDAILSVLGKAFFLSIDIVLIVFGAIFFLSFLKETRYLQAMEKNLQVLSSDHRVQALLLAWLFGGFIEGVAGFGTPAAIVAPLLVGIGFSPVSAVLIALIPNSTAVAFGAVGTPVRIGLASLPIEGVAETSAFINLLAGISVPFMVLAVVAMSQGNKWAYFRQGAPWALYVGFAFLIPYWLFSFIGYEFPSILGAAVGLILAVVSLRLNFLVPAASTSHKEERAAGRPSMKWGEFLRSFSPYLLLVTLLVVGKFTISNVGYSIDLGNSLSHSLQLFNPGLIFLVAIFTLTRFLKKPLRETAALGATTLLPLRNTAISIFFISGITYTMIATSHSAPNSGMLESLAHSMMSPALPLYSAFIGALGSFLAGSATVSNLLFGEIQAQAAQDLGLTTSLVLALQLVGAGIGNMIALPNVLAVQAAVGMEGREASLLKRLFIPCLIYLGLASAVGWLLAL